MGDLELPTKIAPSSEQIYSYGRDHGHEPRDCGFDYESKVWGVNDVRLSPKYLNALRLKYCLDDLKDVQGKVLEVGCGAGGMARAIKFYRPDLEIHGCDISERAVRKSNTSVDKVRFAVSDAYCLPYQTEYFSMVVIFDVLEHLNFPERAISEIFRVLKSDGLFYLFVPCEGSIYTLHGCLNKFGWRAKEEYGGHIQRFNEQSIRDILECGGFGVRHKRWSGHIFNQIVDVLYFSIIALRGHGIHSSVESYLAKAKPGIWTRVVQAMKNLIAWLSYYESSVLRDIPGWGIHLACYKGNKDC